MKKVVSKLKLTKTTFAEEQRLKDLEFLKLKPAERLRINFLLRV
jgi:hypothetical protein